MIKNLYPLGDFNTSQILEFVENVREAKNFENSEEFDSTPILYRRPDAAPNAGDFIKTIPIEEAPFIVPDAFSGKVGLLLAKNLTLPQLEIIGAEGDVYLKEAITINLMIVEKETPKDEMVIALNTYVRQSPAWKR